MVQYVNFSMVHIFFFVFQFSSQLLVEFVTLILVPNFFFEIMVLGIPQPTNNEIL